MKANYLTIKGQENRIYGYFVKYYPVRIRNVGETEKANREKVYSFKDGRDYEDVAKSTAEAMIEKFGDKVKDIVFSCIPASSAAKNTARYMAFSAMVCQLCGCINAFDKVSVVEDRLCVHEHRRENKVIDTVSTLEFDKEFWNTKPDVMVFDDLLSTKRGFDAYAKKLEELGANVLGGLFLGKTYYKVR